MISAVKAFLDNPHTTGALLITGKWGSGKTYFVKNILAPDESIADEYVFVFVSLFGADGVEDISKKVNSSYFQTKGSLVNHALEDGGKLKKVQKKYGNMLAGLGSIIKDSDVLDGVPKLLANALTINWKEFVPIENTVTFDNEVGQEQTRKVVLVFDDLERYISIDPTERTHQVLGVINEYTENQDFKTIILADEDKITRESNNENPYREIKEKAIAQTLSFSTDYYEVFDAIVAEYKDYEDYRKFLFMQKDRSMDAFFDIGENNIRSIINAFALFRAVYAELSEKGVDDEDVRGFFFNFLEIFFYSRNGKLNMNLKSMRDIPLKDLLLLVYQNRNKNDSSPNEERPEMTKDDRRQEQLMNDKYFLSSLFDCSVLGKWSSESLSREIDEFIEKKKPKPELSAKNKIIAGWSLLTIDEESLLDGFRDAVNESYNANLGLDALINIISADYALQFWGVEHESIDWNCFNQGIVDTISKLEKDGEFDSDLIMKRSYISDDSLCNMSDDAKNAYATIDKYNPTARKNRYELLKALRAQDIGEACHVMQHKIFEEFDVELAEAFWNCYKTAALADDRRELFNCFKSIASQITSIYNEGTKREYICCKDVPNTLIAFQELKANMESLCSGKEKPITAVISKRFIETISSCIEILEVHESRSSDHPDEREM